MSLPWRHVALVVEGQTEEAIASTFLVPLAAQRCISLTVMVVHTSFTGSKAHKGGGAWRHMRQHIGKLARQVHWERIGCMFDVYGSEFARQVPSSLRDHALHQHVQQAAEADLLQACRPGEDRLVVGPVLHEIETLVLAAIASGHTAVRPGLSREVRETIDRHGSVELVDGSPQTSPSHRLESWWPRYEHAPYSKVLYARELIEESGWDTVMARCPTYAAWVERLLTPEPPQ